MADQCWPIQKTATTSSSGARTENPPIFNATQKPRNGGASRFNGREFDHLDLPGRQHSGEEADGLVHGGTRFPSGVAGSVIA
jgi:hypothetical protein